MHNGALSWRGQSLIVPSVCCHPTGTVRVAAGPSAPAARSHVGATCTISPTPPATAPVPAAALEYPQRVHQGQRPSRPHHHPPHGRHSAAALSFACTGVVPPRWQAARGQGPAPPPDLLPFLPPVVLAAVPPPPHGHRGLCLPPRRPAWRRSFLLCGPAVLYCPWPRS